MRSVHKCSAKILTISSRFSLSREARLGLRLLTRTTRSVWPTEAGERLVLTVAPRVEEIQAEMQALTELREKPAGTIRITAREHAVSAILWPKLAKFLRQYSDIKVEITVAGLASDEILKQGLLNA